MLEILVPFFGIVALVLAVSYGLIAKKKNTLSSSQGWTKGVFVWFICSGLIHLIIEGYYAINVYDIAGQTNYMSSMWKEYALSDSRYMTIDSTVWMIESITSFGWGPLCIFTAYLIYIDSPIRHLFQFIISFGQFYGDVLYYSTTLVDGSPHCSPNPFHFYFYFVFMNAFWIFIPGLILLSSGKVLAQGLYAIKDKKKDKKLK